MRIKFMQMLIDNYFAKEKFNEKIIIYRAFLS